VRGDAGDIRVLDDDEARDLVESLRHAVYAPEHDPAQVYQQATGQQMPSSPATEPPEPVDTGFVGPDHAAKRIQELVEYTEELGLYENQQAPEDSVPEMTMPWTTAPKATWIDWAVYRGCDPSEAAGMTKNQLMGRYGERL
jgi:hypothetical protein